jgi:hypothetical protein
MPEVPIVREPVESTIDGTGEELAVVVTAGGFDKRLAVGVAVFEPERGTVTRVAVGVSVFKPERAKITGPAVAALGPSPNSEDGSSEFGLSEGGRSVVGLLGRAPSVSKIVKRFERDRN